MPLHSSPDPTHNQTAPVRFLFVDVFTDVPLAGNPLALVPDADDLDDDAMRRLAREFNQAETTFIVKPSRPDADWRLRSFTPAGIELGGGAGHNALGAWWWLAASGRLALDVRGGTTSGAPTATGGDQSDDGHGVADGDDGDDGDAEVTCRFMQEIGDQVLPVDVRVRVRDGAIVSVDMVQSPPVFGAEIIAPDLRHALASALRLSDDDLRGAPLVPQVVSTGAGHLLVPLVSCEAVSRARPDLDRLGAVLREVDGEGCYLFALDPASPEATARARFFNPTVGIDEDIATGTAAGPLACYLIARAIVADGTPVIIEQGDDLQRPSRLTVHVRGTEVRLSGRGAIAAEGTVRVPVRRDRRDRVDIERHGHAPRGAVSTAVAAVPPKPVSELRVAVTAADYATMARFYAEGLGVEPQPLWVSGNERAAILDLGRATLEIFDEPHAASVDAIEAGRRVSGPIRFALRVPDVDEAVARLLDHGATLVREPFVTPWRHRNARLQAPDGLQITLFQVLDLDA